MPVTGNAKHRATTSLQVDIDDETSPLSVVLDQQRLLEILYAWKPIALLDLSSNRRSDHELMLTQGAHRMH